MGYTKSNDPWADGSAGGTPINAAALNNMEDGITKAMPTGTVVPYAGSAAPGGWLLCRGQAVSRSTYADLFNVIGTTFGAGDGSTTFNLPDLQGKFPVGVSGADPDYTLAGTGGEEEHTLTATEMPGHTHTGPSHSHGDGSLASASGGGHSHSLSHHTELELKAGGSTARAWDWSSPGDGSEVLSIQSAGAHAHDVTGSTGAAGTGNSGSTGGGSPHENRPPYLALNMMIRT